MENLFFNRYKNNNKPKERLFIWLKKKEAKQPVCRGTVCAFVSALISAVEEWRRFSTWYSHDRFDTFFEFISIFYQNNLFNKCKYKAQQNNPRRMFWTQILLTAPNKHPRFRVKMEQISHFVLLLWNCLFKHIFSPNTWIFIISCAINCTFFISYLHRKIFVFDLRNEWLFVLY